MDNRQNYHKNKNNKDVEYLIIASKIRIQKEVKEGFKFHHLTDALSNRLLRSHISQRVSMVVMFVDGRFHKNKY